MLNWMIQLHYLGGSSEITPLGNETGRTRGSEERGQAQHPVTRTPNPGTWWWCSPPSIPTPGEAVDGEIRVPSILYSLHSIPKQETWRISVCPFMLCSATEHWWCPSSFRITPSLPVTAWSIPDHGWTERSSTWRAQGLKWCLKFLAFILFRSCIALVYDSEFHIEC